MGESEFDWCNMETPSCTLAIGIQNGPQDKNNGGIGPTQKISTLDNVFLAVEV